MKAEMHKKFMFRMDDKTDGELRHNARSCELSVSSYLRKLIHSDSNEKKISSAKAEYMDYKRLVYEVNRIGNNINQIVKNYNSELYSYKDKNELMKHMEELNRLLSEAAPPERVRF
jgi:hypothetical protein